MVAQRYVAFSNLQGEANFFFKNFTEAFEGLLRCESLFNELTFLRKRAQMYSG